MQTVFTIFLIDVYRSLTALHIHIDIVIAWPN